MIDLYTANTPNGKKISIMLEDNGYKYNVNTLDLNKGDQFRPEFKKISPFSKIPVIKDNDNNEVVFESGAILQYLGRKSGKFYPKNERERVKVDEWIYWQMCGLGPMAGQAHHFRQYAPKKINYAVKRYTDEVNRLYGVMNKQLRKNEYLAGRYSIADMACWGWVKPWKNQGQRISDFPHLKRWLEKVGNRPAVKKGFELGKDLRKQSLADNTKEAKKAKSILFNQRAR